MKNLMRIEAIGGFGAPTELMRELKAFVKDFYDGAICNDDQSKVIFENILIKAAMLSEKYPGTPKPIVKWDKNYYPFIGGKQLRISLYDENGKCVSGLLHFYPLSKFYGDISNYTKEEYVRMFHYDWMSKIGLNFIGKYLCYTCIKKEAPRNNGNLATTTGGRMFAYTKTEDRWVRIV